MEETNKRKQENKLLYYRPYAKQLAFHAAGKTYRERLFMAGNQLGKTIAGGAETAMHLTGLYPDYWEGIRFDGPIIMWASGVTGESTRDNPQRILMGQPGEFGTGFIPANRLDDVTNARGTPNLLDSAIINHVSGGKSRIGFKSYIQGREKWQGPTLHEVWFDEEPPEEIYSEGLTRTNATGGIAMMTFTPLIGMSNVVRTFLLSPTPDRHVTQMTIDDAEHYTPEQREKIVAAYPEHEREARAKGIPTLGSGRIFPVAEEQIKVESFAIPAHWPQIGGMDFGGNDHPYAAVKMAWDRENDIIYFTQTYRIKKPEPVIHAAALKVWGDNMPWAWPHDGLIHDRTSGEPIKDIYASHGLNMLPERATYEDGSYGVEAGLLDMLERMQTGRLKVFGHLHDWFEEFRLYHRKDGKVIKEADDLMAASRYALMMRRFADCIKGKLDYYDLYS